MLPSHLVSYLTSLSCVRTHASRPKPLVRVGVCTLLVSMQIFAAAWSRADDINWIGGSGFWDIAANWSCNPRLPGPLDNVFQNGSAVVEHRYGEDSIFSLVSKGALVVSNSSSLTIGKGGLSLSGTANALRTGGRLAAATNTLFDGGALVAEGNANNRIGIEANSTLTLGSGFIARGQNLRFEGGPTYAISTLVNNGTISADTNQGGFAILPMLLTNNGTLEARNGASLTLDTREGSINTGVLRAMGAGSALSITGNFANSVPLDLADDGATVNISGTFASRGAALNVTNGASLKMTGVTNLDATTLNGATGNLRIDGGTLSLANGVTLRGTLVLDSAGRIVFSSDGTLSADEIVCTANPNNLILVDRELSAVLDTGLVLHGGGLRIASAATYLNSGLTNNARISSDTPAGSFVIAMTRLRNNGVLEAINGGGLTIMRNGENTATGIVGAAGAGSSLVFAGESFLNTNPLLDLATDGASVLISGNFSNRGTLNVTNGSSLKVTGTFAADNTTLNCDDTSLFQARDGGRVDISNRFTLNGTLALETGGTVRFLNDSTLSTGEIVCSTFADNRITFENGDRIVVFGDGVVLHGGTLTMTDASYRNHSLVNLGVISCDNALGTFNIGPMFRVRNRGLIEALFGSSVSVNVTPGNDARIHVDALSTMTLSGDFNQSRTGSLRVGINSPFSGLVQVNGDVNLDGQLVVELADGFQPAVGDSFAILTYKGRASGTFSAVQAADPGYAYSYAVDTDARKLIVTVLQTPGQQ